MADVLDFLTNKTGVVSALVVLVGLVAATVGVVRPTLSDRRARRELRAALVFSEPWLTDVATWSRFCELRFMVSNSGKNTVVLRAVRLVVLSREPSRTLRQTEPAAPVVVHKHRVELCPDRDEYDIRSRMFGRSAEPLSYAQGETEAFIVKLVSREPYRYEFRLDFEWFDATTPARTQIASSDALTVDFPADGRDPAPN
ncbi:hypothetical protein ACFYZ8_41300 [Streptomyces sp. NPDC001668]|uniref:hypothetical protein n=1 Tax=unclassified Streptomyces TaxID=2593676 RepID=UPI0036746A1F